MDSATLWLDNDLGSQVMPPNGAVQTIAMADAIHSYNQRNHFVDIHMAKPYDVFYALPLVIAMMQVIKYPVV